MQELVKKMELVYSLCNNINDSRLIVLAKFLKNRIDNPDSFVVFLGETSSGKSSILNGLMQENILYVSSSPSTGSIIEILSDNEAKEKSYYAINKDATMEIIDKETFDELAKNPDKELERLRLQTNIKDYNFNGLRLFDTPGYNSIVSEHEEVLKEFLPNSDVVIYVVNYKIGIQENDFTFLNFLKELLGNDVDVSIVINRVPEGRTAEDNRIKEILRYGKDILNYEPKYFIINAIQTEDYPLPQSCELWKYIEEKIHSQERQEALKNNFNNFILDLFYQCEVEVNKRYQSIKLNREQKEAIKKEIEEFKNKKSKAIEMIDSTFDRVINNVKKKLQDVIPVVNSKICSSIDAEDRMLKDETIAYVNSHLLPFTIKQEVSEVQRYISIELEDLDKQLENYLNTVINQFVGKIEIIFSSFMDKAQINIAQKLGEKILNQGLLGYFAKYGGAGKAAAGVANAASHLLKKIGEIFGKTFSKSTHNALKQFLSKIGATSTKAIGAAAAVVIELASMIIDYATWKSKLKGKVKDGVEKWYEEAKPAIIKDLEKLREENKKNITEIFDNFSSQYEYEEEIPNEKETMELLDNVERIKNEIGA
ncbi:dynamin family protein [Brachyspira alvinipulli]|uniref:dynamin family protein n=1 Tax=Brachyspira alvinipulli TaxID=84379 RepID=UPI00048889EB|nr:dynamin family protein [Brachyspira alvinipulli]